jgi:hypothetical protein
MIHAHKVGMFRSGVGMFQAPFTVTYDAKFATDPPRAFKLSVLCIPTKPGWSRAIILGPSMKESDKAATTSTEVTAVVQSKLKKGSIASSLMRLAFTFVPVWISHQLGNRFLDSDLAFLHYQGQERQRRNYFMPSPADRCIAAFRAWVSKYTDSNEQQLPPVLSRSEMFDRWTQHTSHCIHCQRGMKFLRRFRQSAFATLAISILGFKYNLARWAIILCLGSILIVDKIEANFMEGEFKHYENH